jgi:hypothetical protein
MAVIYSITQLAEALNLEPWNIAYHLKVAEIKPLATVAGHRLYGLEELAALRSQIEAHSYLVRRDHQRTQGVKTA